jgi:hypothetical protein
MSTGFRKDSTFGRADAVPFRHLPLRSILRSHHERRPAAPQDHGGMVRWAACELTFSGCIVLENTASSNPTHAQPEKRFGTRRCNPAYPLFLQTPGCRRSQPSSRPPFTSAVCQPGTRLPAGDTSASRGHCRDIVSFFPYWRGFRYVPPPAPEPAPQVTEDASLPSHR